MGPLGVVTCGHLWPGAHPLHRGCASVTQGMRIRYTGDAHPLHRGCPRDAAGPDVGHEAHDWEDRKRSCGWTRQCVCSVTTLIYSDPNNARLPQRCSSSRSDLQPGVSGWMKRQAAAGQALACAHEARKLQHEDTIPMGAASKQAWCSPQMT